MAKSKAQGQRSSKRPREPKAMSDYDRVISEVFRRHYRKGEERLEFDKDEIAQVCQEQGITVRNTPDVVYTYRARQELPPAILAKGHWAIQPAGRGKYAFRLLSNPARFEVPFGDYSPVDIYNAIPEVVEGLLRKDEQSLVTTVVYNRLVDIFTGLTCFHIQSHYRSFLKRVGEVELDALFVGVDKTGTLHVVPVEAKSQAESEMIGRVQVWQMAMLARQDFGKLQRRIIAVKALRDETVGFVEFDDQTDPDEFGIVSVSRFRLIRRPRR